MNKYEVVYHDDEEHVMCTTKTLKEADTIVAECNARKIEYVSVFVRKREDRPYKGYLLFLFFPEKHHPSKEFTHDISYDYHSWDELEAHDAPHFAVNAATYDEAYTAYLQWLDSDAYKKQIEHYTEIDNAKGWGEYYEGDK